MKNFMGAIYEHLITKRKYNKLKIKLDVKRDEYEKKVVELNTERRIHNKQRDAWENKITEQEKEIIDLKEKLRNLRRRKREKENEKED